MPSSPRTPRFVRRRLALLAGALASALVSHTRAQSAPEANAYREHSFGFEMQIPAGWSYDRTRFAGPGGALGLLRGRSVAERATLQVLIYRSFDAPTLDKWVDRFAVELTRPKDTQLRERRARPAGEREGVVLELDTATPDEVTRSFYYCVAFDSSTVWLLLYAGVAGPADPPEPLRERFESIAQTLRILVDPVKQDEIAAALTRGREFLARLAERARALKADGDTHYYRIEENGTPVGYLSRRTSIESQTLDAPSGRKHAAAAAKEGVRVRERTWRFASDGGAAYARIDLFASLDLESELIETEHAQVPAPTAPVPTPTTVVDQAIREDTLLFSSVRSSFDKSYPPPREPLRIGNAYLGAGWTRVLPALLGTEAGETVAFAIYDAPTRALITHVVRPLGPRPLAGSAEPAFAYEVREAFAAKPATLFTDRNGVMLRLEAPDATFVRTTEREIEQRFAKQRDAAKQRLSGGR